MKAKFKVSSLAAKAVEFELVHPIEGDTGIMVKMVGPHSKQFRDVVGTLGEITDATERGLEVLSKCIVGWDEEAFEQPFTTEAAEAYFKSPENQWAAECLGVKVSDEALFFKN